MDTIRARIVTEALAWLGTPYHHEADIQGAGVDCAMLLVRVYHAAGLIPAIDPRPYPADWMLHQSEERYLGWVAQYGDPVAAPLPGDLVLYKVGRCYSHAGIVVAWPEIVHAFRAERGVVRSRFDAGRLAGRDMQFWRVRGVE
ncbi:MAG: NlpC/P60 family protein [Rhodocyclaceae bacterium]|nr:NlpC/P60 family protein [Rhodocyclaceae bacterium]